MRQRGGRVGVIAIGSNSVRMLTADLDERLSNPVRGREETALFLSMDDRKRFSEQGMERAAQAISKLYHQAREAGAGEVYMIATSAMRDASNRNELDYTIAATCPLVLNRIISGQEEARLGFLGAVCVPPRPGLLGMIDIGGGSTEVAIGRCDGGLDSSVSLQLGASRLLQRQRVEGAQGLAAARALAFEVVSCGLRPRPQAPDSYTLVGGTGTTFAAMLTNTPWPLAAPEGSAISEKEVSQWLERLALMDEAERAALTGMPPTRVHILPTGLVILEAVMHWLEIDTLTITHRGNLDGYLYSLCHQREDDADA